MTEDLSTPEQVRADLCLKFQDEAAAFAALYEPTEVEGEYKPRHKASIDTIGVIYRPIGDMDAEGNFLTAPLPGWHVNLRGSFTPDELEALAPFVVTPENPVRVWA